MYGYIITFNATSHAGLFNPNLANSLSSPKFAQKISLPQTINF